MCVKVRKTQKFEKIMKCEGVCNILEINEIVDLFIKID